MLEVVCVRGGVCWRWCVLEVVCVLGVVCVESTYHTQPNFHSSGSVTMRGRSERTDDKQTKVEVQGTLA